jgi:thioredoxin reductase (NADPH)
MLIESESIGGQAGSSSLIRNYLGFPRGVSGEELTFRAWEQMLLFGAQYAFTDPATGLVARGNERILLLANGDELRARTVVIAAGVSYRRLGIPSLDRLIGAGVFYGTAGSEARAMAGENVYVIGGANSAGQAALNLAKYAARVTLLIRGHSLEAGMSDYLIRQIESTPNVSVRTGTQVVDAYGGQRLQGLVLEGRETGAREEVQAAGVFVLIGAEPRTDWLQDVLERDDRGFILTGSDVLAERWPLDRRPLPFETSMPGVFAVGDVRHGSVKRVAGAVGEGSVAIGSVHQYIAEPERVATGRHR